MTPHAVIQRSPRYTMKRSSSSGDEAGNWTGDDSEDEGDTNRTRKRQKIESEGRPTSVSCETCKHRKVKCDRGQPSCGWCLKNLQTCEYKERKKPGLRAGYGRELEAKLAEQSIALGQLREMLQRHETLIAQLSNDRKAASSSTTLSGSPDTSTFQQQHVHAAFAPRTEAALFLQKPMSYSSRTTYDTQYNLYPAQTAKPVTVNALHESAAAGIMPPLRDPFERSLSHTPHHHQARFHDPDLPDHDLCYALCDLYFSHINQWIPILHRKQTMDMLFDKSLGEEETILLHAIIVTSLKFSNDRRITSDFRYRQHRLSKEKVQLYGLQNSSVKALQALVIIALDIMGSSHGPSGWNMLALIARSAVQLGLGVEPTSLSVAPVYPSIYTLRTVILPEPKDFIEDESRRRLMWAIFLLDRYATVATAFDFALAEKDLERKLPCRDDFFNINQATETPLYKQCDSSYANRADNLGTFSYFTQLIGILSHIHDFLRQPVDIGAIEDVAKWQGRYRDLDRDLESWRYSLPPDLRGINHLDSAAGRASPSDSLLILLHATYFTSIIRLHSSAAYPTTRSPIFQPSYTAAQQCQTAVENVITVLDHATAHSLLPSLGPFFAFSLWVAARVVLVHGSTIDRRINPCITTLVSALRSMGIYWKVAERYGMLLQRVLDEFQSTADGEEPPSSIKILADMRRTAFDLDRLISRAPKQLNTQQVRTPNPGDLECLDVFDFFNVPRLDPQGNSQLGEFNGKGFGSELGRDWLTQGIA